MSLELWNSLFETGGVILLFLTFLFGAGALLTSKRINKRQAEQLRKFDADLTNAKTQLVTQQQRAAEAELKLLKERQHSANREIPAQEQQSISEKLRVFAGQQASVDVFPVTFETRSLAGEIFGVLLNAKWRIPGLNLLSVPPDFMVQGVCIRSTADTESKAAASELFRLLMRTDASGILDHSPLPDSSKPRVWILVGDKPTALRSWVK